MAAHELVGIPGHCFQVWLMEFELWSPSKTIVSVSQHSLDIQHSWIAKPTLRDHRKGQTTFQNLYGNEESQVRADPGGCVTSAQGLMDTCPL